jgi:hypothetical protein
LQLNHVDFNSYTAIGTDAFAAIMSALVVNQSTKKLSFRAAKRTVTSRKQWKWIAYGLFSKRAYSALEAVAFNQADALSAMDAAAVATVLNTEHPENVICGSAAGVVAERNAKLQSGSPIRWRFSHGQPVVDDKYKVIETKSAIRCLRTFSDDGGSEWVNAIIPGLGREVPSAACPAPSRLVQAR